MYNAGSSSISMCAGQQHNCSLNIINMQIDIEQNNHPVIHFPWPDQISSHISDINETSTLMICYVFCHQRNVIANMNMKQIKMQINNINTNIGLLDSIFEIYVDQNCYQYLFSSIDFNNCSQSTFLAVLIQIFAVCISILEAILNINFCSIVNFNIHSSRISLFAAE